MRPRSLSPARQQGFTLLALLFAVALLGVGMAAVGTMWHTAAQRDKEAQLLFAGDQYRRAIDSFWMNSPGGQKSLPKGLDDLLRDPRFPNVVRHLRRFYSDPMTGKNDWVLLQDANGGIMGLYSRSEMEPLKKANFPLRYERFANMGSYRDWVFMSESGANPKAVGGVGTSEEGGESSGAEGGQGASADSKTATGAQSPGTAANGGGPTQVARPATGGTASTERESANQTACINAMFQGLESCRAPFKQGDMVTWNACRDVVIEQFRNCRGGI